ncbi:hypothetical protein IVB69_04835 [Flavobacterium sp. J49]|uniref:hypothetical protein n=1 Tax=Flavobacterium sp. J49 TaxID=2718534 RepID=UPI001594A077|nr:hypothetical protein [Flavobacterium sp. J49]MBF6640794.1 hypothetical protein [Flavobacterium sp. J49]NIC02041.1 hypothetical protein [Flavobacterium sp. J49]
MRIFMPIVFVILFILYVLYLAIIKKELKQNLSKVVYPGLFFIVVWALLYFVFL